MEPEAWQGTSRSAEATEAFGEALGGALESGACIALVGDLGCGKTTFVRGLARGLDVREAVTSPTFTRLRVLPGRRTLHHFDAWREGSAALLAESQEFLAGDAVAVVEWAERVEGFLPRPRIELAFAHAAPTVRAIRARVVPPEPGAGSASRRAQASLLRALAAAARSPGVELAPVDARSAPP
jgi:tRNA threonylcarbamoyladenosine biosynthesis protein TsaE